MSTLLARTAQEAARSLGTAANPDMMRLQLLQSAAVVAMDETGLLDEVTLQGGSAIVGCYGGLRMSRDLDFCSARTPTKGQAEAFSEGVEDVVRDLFDIKVRVKSPAEARCGVPAIPGKVAVARWEVRAESFEDRPDLPLDVLKVEVAAVPHETERVLEFRPPALAAMGSKAVAIVTESPTELVADKVVSLCAESRFVRYRDLWDIAFLDATCLIDRRELSDLVVHKATAYGIDMSHLQERAQTLRDSNPEVEFASSLEGMLVTDEARESAAGGRRTTALVNRAMGIVVASVGRQMGFES